MLFRHLSKNLAVCNKMQIKIKENNQQVLMCSLVKSL